MLPSKSAHVNALHRICPGMYMAYSSIWISVVSILAVFDITKATAPDGSFIEPSHEHETGILA